ncbi:Triacylglycerol esterase/lipase EstA, alpha/beta hydrolase fold [Haloechinothrix alba]|uniref:Triacylglycerol esterase/lipase EstA, alpha/beta hydrolase fold n=1 Tax=Haloechinothrix alba TaxID=664784 RepID=A0A238V0R0_9PSEU|nr:alpha/beta hydrolase [Haloechinothrix alba]SNR27856.1 Triacylglycerol esterase/lipase EstA, alpha/beta hydrolase fold [Haloechinothrix alba]
MTRTYRLGTVLAAATVLLGLGGGVPASAEQDPGPPLEQSPEELDATLHCDSAIDDPDNQPVLFVPGTTADGYENFSFNYVHALRAEGYSVCWMDYPHRGWRDMQTSTENAVHAIRTMYERSGGQPVSTLGHSQGGLHPAWAARFWPDMADKLDDAISLGSPFQGSVTANAYCEGLGLFAGGCQESFWQFTQGSSWTEALNAQPLPDGPSFTSIYTEFDEAATPGAEASALTGSSHVAVQDVCTARAVEHFGLVVDAAVYALVLDALENPGGAAPERVDGSVCTEVFMPLDYGELATQLPELLAMPARAWLESPPWTWEREEPPLRDYAR